jgi:hypothetical protein
MEELIWVINIFGLEIGWTKYKLHNFYRDSTFRLLLYIGHLRLYKD